MTNLSLPIESAILAATPFLYYPLDELAGPTATDQSGNSHNGTYHSVPHFGIAGIPCAGDTAINFNPQITPDAHRVIGPTGFGDSSTFTALIWIRYFSFTTASECFASNLPTPAGSGWGMQWNAVNGFECFAYCPGPTFVECIAPLGSYNWSLNLGINKWHLFVETISATQLSFYIDGGLAHQVALPAAHVVSTDSAVVGCLNSNPNYVQPYTAHAAHFALYSRVLTATEISTIWSGLANCRKGRGWAGLIGD
jgi:hypothetical protein